MTNCPYQSRLIEVAKANGMDVGITRGNPIVLYVTWHAKRERLNEIVVRDDEGSAEAGAHILTNWTENRPKKETV